MQAAKAIPFTRTLHARSAVVPPLPLRVRAGRRVARLDRGSIVVGSSAGCDLVIEDASVSRRHVELEIAPEGVIVRDLESRNGTWYLGQRVERMIASPPTLLRIGGTTLAIEIDPDAGAEPLRRPGFRGMVGSSDAMHRLFGALARLDGSLVPALVLGETGVGKEVVARAIHEGSRVADGPFVAVNCGALARELVASTLFGHRRGAFTGATDARRGAFAAAQGGTLFLDELGELPLEIQPALLRALECGEITPIGEDTPQRVNVRVVAATNRDLEAEVRAGRFREDLYFRLAVVTLRIPALRERPEDVAPLADYFARQEGLPGLPADVVAELEQRAFPGNVRELRNAVRAYAAIGVLDDRAPRSSMIVPTMEPPVSFDAPYLAQRDALVDRFTQRYVSALLERTNGNQTAAAKLAGLDRTYFGRLLAKLGRR
ncbi:MAG: sigma 54-interacting transcriptional regulator [Labilithrix sp.]|nr:sigma 54-interacting transcriptional regulator [Labilithrix sp.]MCW5817534.1 sigma 54-interacting transcriptional regulator [Labilithrix sp.]